MTPLRHLLLALLLLPGCVNQPTTLFEQLGGSEGIQRITSNFILEIEKNPDIFPYFSETDVQRFEEQFQNHVCEIAKGPCIYNGDDMQRVHDGMKITERDFNIVVDLLINAMDTSSISHRTQNELLHRLASFRKDIIYR